MPFVEDVRRNDQVLLLASLVIHSSLPGQISIFGQLTLSKLNRKLYKLSATFFAYSFCKSKLSLMKANSCAFTIDSARLRKVR